MLRWLRALGALSLLLTAGALPASAGWFGPPTLEPYKGADAGRLVLALGASYDSSFVSYILRIRPRDKSSTADIRFLRGGFSAMKSEYSSDIDIGVIPVFALAPGDYEVYSLELIWASGGMTDTFTPKQEFSIPFTVKAGETVYLGKFRVEETQHKNFLGLPMADGAFFYISDASAHDLPIAKAKDPAIGDARVALPDIDALANPIFRRDTGKLSPP